MSLLHSLLSAALSLYFCEEIWGFVSLPSMNSMGAASQHSPHVIIRAQAQNNPLTDPRKLFTTSSFIIFLRIWEMALDFLFTLFIQALGQLLLPHLRAGTEAVPALQPEMDITHYAEACLWKDRHFLKGFRNSTHFAFVWLLAHILLKKAKNAKPQVNNLSRKANLFIRHHQASER